MDLSTFQLVDAINDMDMLRNLSGQPQPEQYTHSQQSNNNNAYNQLHGDIDMLFQSDQLSGSPHVNSYLAYKNNCASTTGVSTQSNQIMSSPHYRSTPNNQRQNDCFDQEDILTPLISPAMTPSFSYQVQQQKHHQTINFNSGNDMDFSPLSSPAILPQIDRHRNQQSTRTSFQDQLASAVATDSNSNPTGDSYKNMSANQICEQYEQLEHAKMLITQKLSELQKSQRHHSNQFNDDHQGYQRSLLSSESNSSKDSSSSLSNTNGTSMMQQKQMNSDQMSIHHQNIMSRPSSPNKSPPRMEPATPASLMNMKMNTNHSSKLQFSSSGRTQQFYSKPISTTSSSAMNYNVSPSMVPTNKNHIFQSPSMTSTPIHENMIISPMMTPSTTSSTSNNTTTPTLTATTHQTIPLSPLALHPRTNTKVRSSSILKEKSSPSRFSKKQRRESSDSKSTHGAHASPRALKPLLISPTLNPGIKPLPSTIIPARSVHSVEDAERILATRSNYQNLMEGKGAALGIAFSTQIKSGLEVRRTAHKAAEQKRRDSLKEWFDRLRREVEDGYVKRQKTLMSQVIKAQELEKNNNNKQRSNTTDEEMEEASAVDSSAMKPLSKVLLLQYAYEYISSLKTTLEERDSTIEKLLSDELGSSKSSIGSLKRRQDDEDDFDNDMTYDCL
ncbi:hypothetical protein INT48_001865 [Thamnidium elegans]|uniref:BHLH domain-containing protein n=1 Tax=Thamnidium elegans TaxID=101142 RepID=A0A8H7SQV3_9FUNG|nr:hypothetical protein INT48_001865 [Thamnidium elegans]